MNKRQLNKFRMFSAIETVLDTNSVLVSSLNDLMAANARLKAGQLLIIQNRQVQEAKITGLTRNKSTMRDELILSIMKYSAALKSYGITVKDEEIRAKASYTPSDLKKVADSVIYDIGMLLYGLAVPLKAEMARYFIGEAELKAMEQLLEAFKLTVPKRRVASSLSKTSTGNIESLFTAQDKLLKDEIDVLMSLFQVSQPDFYNAYKNARAIVNYVGRGKGAPAEEPVAIH
jgi:hypothetical protein